MTKSYVDIDGIEEMIMAFNRITDERANTIVVAGAKEAAELLQVKAKEKVSVRSGNLRDAITVKRLRARAQRYSRHVSQPVYTVGVRAVRLGRAGGVNYGPQVELGHLVKVHGRYVGESPEKPYLRPAADENEKKVEQILVAALDKSLEMFGE